MRRALLLALDDLLAVTREFLCPQVCRSGLDRCRYLFVAIDRATRSGVRGPESRHERARAPTGPHQFDRLCRDLGIEHRLTPPRHPHTNGMVERFNGRIVDPPDHVRGRLCAHAPRPVQ